MPPGAGAGATSAWQFEPKLQPCSSSALLTIDVQANSHCPALTYHQQGTEERVQHPSSHMAAWHPSDAGAVIRLQRTAVASVLRAR